MVPLAPQFYVTPTSSEFEKHRSASVYSHRSHLRSRTPQHPASAPRRHDIADLKSNRRQDRVLAMAWAIAEPTD